MVALAVPPAQALESRVRSCAPQLEQTNNLIYLQRATSCNKVSRKYRFLGMRSSTSCVQLYQQAYPSAQGGASNILCIHF